MYFLDICAVDEWNILIIRCRGWLTEAESFRQSVRESAELRVAVGRQQVFLERAAGDASHLRHAHLAARRHREQLHAVVEPRRLRLPQRRLQVARRPVRHEHADWPRTGTGSGVGALAQAQRHGAQQVGGGGGRRGGAVGEAHVLVQEAGGDASLRGVDAGQRTTDELPEVTRLGAAPAPGHHHEHDVERHLRHAAWNGKEDKLCRRLLGDGETSTGIWIGFYRDMRPLLLGQANTSTKTGEDFY